MLIERRIQQLTDNIRKDMGLLNDYEDELRYETDPRRLARYHREIERQRESLSRYQQEYDELRGQVTGEPPAGIQDAADQLRQMDAKLDGLTWGQKAIQDDLQDFRKTLLARFDDSEQTIISTVVQRLDQNQSATVRSILDEIEANRLPESELQETLSAVLQALSEIKQNEAGCYDSQLVGEAANLSEVVDDPKLDVNHKLKVSIPIIPLILKYETEVGLKGGLNLKAVWQRLKAWRGKG
jgi:septation ring formation regulator EzrA